MKKGGETLLQLAFIHQNRVTGMNLWLISVSDRAITSVHPLLFTPIYKGF